jgi:hypothetical protein
MAFILVFVLLKPEGYSSLSSQIILLQVQSKVRNSIPAMRKAHDWRHEFVILISSFQIKLR